MTFNKPVFDENQSLQKLRHYLPAQAPLKDFVHHNTLHAFQKQQFHKAIQTASEIFGYKVYMALVEYRELYRAGKINPQILTSVIERIKGTENAKEWEQKLLYGAYTESLSQKTGLLRSQWKSLYKVNLDKEVHPLLFRLAGSYLDQGIAIWKFPGAEKGLLDSIRELHKKSFWFLFKSARVLGLLHNTACELKDLLDILVGDEALYERYLFDQQFAHPGWAGMTAVTESHPESLLDARKITLRDFIALELLLEIEVLDRKTKGKWKPLGSNITTDFAPLFGESADTELNQVYALWQEAFEWSYYDQVLRGLQQAPVDVASAGPVSFQALFCIDDRECSIRRHIEKFDAKCQTYGTAGFFNVPFYFQPAHGKFYTKVCPVPVIPHHLVKESGTQLRHEKEAHFSKHSKGLLTAWIISQTVGFWAAIKLAWSIFKPTETPAMVSSFRHMDKNSTLSIECAHPGHKEHSLQTGFTVTEMADRVEGLLKSIGLVNGFAPLVYIMGHGASSVNNTHYAGYDCGACGGRAGSANARVAAYMANKTSVRELLKQRGIDIPITTWFIGALHDTTRDETEFYDEDALSSRHLFLHKKNLDTFKAALSANAKERSRRFLIINSKDKAEKVHRRVKRRALSLFEPRPEWNHATNAICVVGRRETNKHLFLDRRSFLNSYNYTTDPDGKLLLTIMKAVIPVCGGINLEYFFSKMDNYRLGAGTKLPHNVMGLIGVANGMDGDLRFGLPRQMLNIHDPVRLMIVVEHYPDVVLKTIQQDAGTYEWIKNEWVRLAVTHPETKEIYIFKNGQFVPYAPVTEKIPVAANLDEIFETTDENLPVYILK